MAKTKLLICPYCGDAQPHADRCRACGGLFESLSRRASHNAMGPWFVRDPNRPHHPGFSYETLVRLVERGSITKYSIVRGPTTRQFWNVARRVPGAAHLLGHCHACDGPVDPDDHGCPHCGVAFGAFLDRNHLGLPEVQAMPDDPNGDEDENHFVKEDRVTLQPYDRADGRQRLSSFASNRELFEPGSTANGHAADGAGTNGSADQGPGSPDDVEGHGAGGNGRGAAAHRPESTAPGVEVVLGHPTVRAMQRRIAQQQRTVRVLAVLLTVAVLAAIVVTAIAFRARQDSGTPGRTGQDTASAVTAPASAGSDRLARAEPPATAPATTPTPATATGHRAAEPGLPKPGHGQGGADATTATDAAPTRPVADAMERYETALVLFAAALESERSVAERLRDAESALALLRGVEDMLLGSEQVPDLAREIAAMEEEIERLRLRGFFGGG